MVTKHTKHVIILFILLIFTIVPSYSKFKKPHTIKYDKVVVYPGDTLWSIAGKYGDGNQDIRKIIYNIQEVNKLNSPIIMPGQVILVPEN